MDTSAVINVNVQSNDTPQAQYKTVVLKPNMVDDVNTLTQAMLTVHGQNTKFVIKYDFTLGEDITVPANCVLEFDGGSLSNGTINFNNTYINAPCETIFKNISIPLNSSGMPNTIQEITYLDWFFNDNNIGGWHKSYLSALQIGGKVVLTAGKEYVFNKCFTTYQCVMHDVEIAGNSAIFIFESGFTDSTNYPDVLYHFKHVWIHDINVQWNCTNATRVINNETRCKQSRFLAGHKDSADCSLLMENIIINVPYTNDGQGTLYETYTGHDFIIRNCKKVCNVSRTFKSGGSFAWFMLNDDGNLQVNITVENCFAITNGNDETFCVYRQGNYTNSKTVNTHISNCDFKSIWTLDTISIINFASDNSYTLDASHVFSHNILIDGCKLRKSEGRPTLIFFYTENKVKMNAIISNCELLYDGTYEGAVPYGVLCSSAHPNCIERNIEFINCKIVGNYLFDTQSENKVGNSFVLCDISVTNFSDARDSNYNHATDNIGGHQRFISCNINLSNVEENSSTSFVDLERCNIYIPNNIMFMIKTNGAVARIITKGTSLNNKKLPDVDLFSPIACRGTSYKWSAIADQTTWAICVMWYNFTGESATVKIFGNTYTVDAGGRLREQFESSIYTGLEKIPCEINGNIRYVYLGTLDSYNNNENKKNNILCAGTTANRPTLDVYEGFQYLDTTLGKPIWYAGNNTWVDATGTPV